MLQVAILKFRPSNSSLTNIQTLQKCQILKLLFIYLFFVEYWWNAVNLCPQFLKIM